MGLGFTSEAPKQSREERRANKEAMWERTKEGMSNEMVTYYVFRDGTKISLIHYVNNKAAAEKAMLQTYRRSPSDISHSGFGSDTHRKDWPTFDGRSFH